MEIVQHLMSRPNVAVGRGQSNKSEGALLYAAEVGDEVPHSRATLVNNLQVSLEGKMRKPYEGRKISQLSALAT